MDLKKALKLDKTDRFESVYNGEKFWFEAKSEFVTPKFLQQLAEMSNKPIEFAAALSTAITAWDIDMGGEPFPPTLENLASTPKTFLNHLFDVISEAYAGNARTPQQSESSLEAAAR